MDLKKHCETRFASQIIMLQRYQALRIVVEALVSNPTYRAWLAKQKPDVRMRGEIVRGIVNKESALECSRPHRASDDSRANLVAIDGW